MKILYLTDNDSVHNRRFLEELVCAGYEMWSWNLAATQAPKNGLPSGVQSIVSTKRIDRSASTGPYRELLPQFQSVVKQLRPALVHAGPIQSGGYLAALADFHPLLLMSWGSDLLIEAERNSEWKQATEFALQKADAFFCDCDAVRQRANNFRMFSDSQVVQFPWGVKQGVFSPVGPLPPADRFERTAGTTTFIYTRSYDPLYGTDVLLDAFRRARSTNPSLRLLLLGNGSEDQGIRSFVQACGLNDAVSLLGPQPAEELPMWFRAADAYISCAKSDGTSISLLEAMATGLPVVVTDIPSNREWVTEPENGWLAPAGSPEGVAHRMLQVANLTTQERKTISERNQRVVAERADWDKNFPRLLEMYERLVGQAAKSCCSGAGSVHH
ncbi:MAG: glycosyltransferase family 4 protein [Terriglobales bacterium]